MDSLHYLLDEGLPGSGSGNSTLPLPEPPVDRQSCSLLGGTGLAVQGLMGLLVLGTLLLKRYKENPKRTWAVWVADVSKQVIGQAFLHASNLAISTLVSHHENRDACTAYFLSILVDCTLGVLVIYTTLRLFSYVLITRLHLPGFRTGQYYAPVPLPTSPCLPTNLDSPILDPSSSSANESARPPFQITWWVRQLVVYLITLSIMKLAILGFFWIPQVWTFGDAVLSWLGEHAKIIFVLMVFPLLMNAFQFFIIDTILKSSQHKPSHASSNLSDKVDDDDGHHSSGDDDGPDGDNSVRKKQRKKSTQQKSRDYRSAGAGDDEESQAFLSSSLRDHVPDRITDASYPEQLPAYRNASSGRRSGHTSPVYPPHSSRMLKSMSASSATSSNAHIHASLDPLDPIRPTSPDVTVSVAAGFSEKEYIKRMDILPVHQAQQSQSTPRHMIESEKVLTDSPDNSGWEWLDEDEDEHTLGERTSHGLARTDSARIAMAV